MKRRFRITITPDKDFDTYFKLRSWIDLQWKKDLDDRSIHFRGWTSTNSYCVGIELERLDKTAKAL